MTRRHKSLSWSGPNKTPNRHARKLVSLESLESRQLLTSTGFEGAEFADNNHETPAEVAYQEAGRVLRIVNGTRTTDYEAVGIVNGQCSGTLIASNMVLTAGHCIPENANERQDFEAEGRSYSASRAVVHPAYNSGVDLAVMALNQHVAGISPVEINRTTPQVGQMLTLVGYGATGSAQNGHDGSFGVKHVGTTPIDEVTPIEVNWNFDHASESNTAPGDSGGAAFLNVGGALVLAGVTSGGATDDAGLGDTSFDIRVDAFADWIDGIVAGGSGTEDPNSPIPPDPTPNPGPQDPDDPGGWVPDEWDAEQLALDELASFDTNGDDELSEAELVAEFISYGDSEADAVEFARALVADFDENGNERLDIRELTASYEDTAFDSGFNGSDWVEDDWADGCPEDDDAHSVAGLDDSESDWNWFDGDDWLSDEEVDNLFSTGFFF